MLEELAGQLNVQLEWFVQTELVLEPARELALELELGSRE